MGNVYTCDRCEEMFQGDGYGEYHPIGYSEILNREPDLAERIRFICGDFYKVTTPLWGIKETLFLCGSCRLELTSVLDLYFAPMMEDEG